MSWDVYFLKLPDTIAKVQDITDADIGLMGTMEEVSNQIKNWFPDVVFRGPDSADLRRDSYSIDFSLQGEEQVTCLALRIRGNEEVMEVLRLIHKETGWTAMDGGTGILDFDKEPERGLREWQQYRDYVVGTLSPKKPWWKLW